MNDDDLRALVRESIARQLDGRQSGVSQAGHSGHVGPAMVEPRLRASHAIYMIPRDDDSCIIEPSVPCNHCNYCKSHGH